MSRILLDPEDAHVLARGNWYVTCSGYVRRDFKVDGRKLYELLHRVVLNAPEGAFVDHINGDKQDNRKSNLRLCSAGQNNMNRGPSKTNQSGFKGVWYDPRRKKYRATIRANKKKHCLGSFDVAEEAADAYNKAALAYHGEFARLN